MSQKISTVVKYYKELQDIFTKIKVDESKGFAPAFELPELTESLKNYFSCGTMSCSVLGSYKNKNLYFLDLMENPDTQTTKTIPSLLMVARAVQHIQKTGEAILIVTPSSGNKAIALRNAVERAISCDLVKPEQLRILTLTPKSAIYKLRESGLTVSEKMLKLNPVGILDSKNSEDVKVLASIFVEKYRDELYKTHGLRVWYTLDINNYKVADALRAFCCNDALEKKQYVHAHAVSSAFGLLGFDFGNQILKELGVAIIDPYYFLVQHLQTHAMVENIITDNSLKNPSYKWNETIKLFEQSNSPYFPYHTHSVDECIDPTFYTRNPLTNKTMGGIIQKNGGGGIVVSKYECLNRYEEIRLLLGKIKISLPEDIKNINEWSLVMVMTGVLNAVDRNVIVRDDIVIHGSGFYSNDDYSPIKEEQVTHVSDAESLFALF